MMMNPKLVVVTISFVLSWHIVNLNGCSQQGEDLTALIEDNCAQHPINWLQLDQKYGGKAQYYFGKNDKKFRADFQKHLKSFQETGQDLHGKEKVQWVNQYVPEYVAACKEFYSNVVRKCGGFDLKSQHYKDCAKSYDYRYKKMIKSFVVKEFNSKGKLDVSKISLIKIEQAYRQELFKRSPAQN